MSSSCSCPTAMGYSLRGVFMGGWVAQDWAAQLSRSKYYGMLYKATKVKQIFLSKAQTNPKQDQMHLPPAECIPIRWCLSV